MTRNTRSKPADHGSQRSDQDDDDNQRKSKGKCKTTDTVVKEGRDAALKSPKTRSTSDANHSLRELDESSQEEESGELRSPRQKFVNERNLDASTDNVEHNGSRSRSTLDVELEAQPGTSGYVPAGTESGNQTNLNSENNNEGIKVPDEAVSLMYVKLKTQKSTMKSATPDDMLIVETVTTPPNELNEEQSFNERLIHASIEKGRKRLNDLFNTGSEPQGGVISSSESSSSSSSESSSDSSSSSDEGRYRKKRKHHRRYQERKYKPKKRKYKRSRQDSRSRSRSHKNKRAKVTNIEALPEFKDVLNRKLKELGYTTPTGVQNKTPARSAQGKQQPLLMNKTAQSIAMPLKSPSDTTVYAPAVQRVEKFHSPKQLVTQNRITEQQVADQLNKIRLSFPVSRPDEDTRTVQLQDEPQPSTSGGMHAADNLVAAAKEAANTAVIQAEKFKAKLLNPVGELNVVDTLKKPKRDDDEFVHIMIHVSPELIEKIQRGEYVDLEKLVKKNRTSGLDADPKDMGLDVITKDGHTYLTTRTDKSNTINNIKKWEQAFRVYAAVYSGANPTRAAEIWQYVEVINRAASRYVWDNIANYDYQFRKWMGDNPQRSWSKTLLQLWSLELIDQIPKQSNIAKVRGKSADNVCWKFNRGKCKKGRNCGYEHRCTWCGLTNHGYSQCRRKPRNGTSSGNEGSHSGGQGRSHGQKKKEKRKESGTSNEADENN